MAGTRNVSAEEIRETQIIFSLRAAYQSVRVALSLMAENDPRREALLQLKQDLFRRMRDTDNHMIQRIRPSDEIEEGLSSLSFGDT